MLKKTYLIDETPGNISNIYEIKILICRILNEIDEKITKNQLSSALQISGTVNYFNFCQAIKELLFTKHVLEKKAKNGENHLNLTPLGEETAKTLNNIIPINIIKKNICSIKELLKEEHENKNKKIFIKEENEGFLVKLMLKEAKNNLLKVELFCPTFNLAEKAKNEMKTKTIEIYNSILSIINGDKKTLLKIASNLEKKH